MFNYLTAFLFIFTLTTGIFNLIKSKNTKIQKELRQLYTRKSYISLFIALVFLVLLIIELK